MKNYDFTETGKGRERSREGRGGARNRRYTDPEVKMMREYRAGGWPIGELQLLFGGSRRLVSDVCTGRAYRDSPGPLTKRNWNTGWDTAQMVATPGKCAEVRELGKQGLTHRQAAEKAGISKTLAGAILRGETRF
jgi:hypothetical protein